MRDAPQPIRITYDEQADAAYVYLCEIEDGGVAKTYLCDPIEVDGMINLDFDADGKLIGIEIVGAKGKFPEGLFRKIAAAPKRNQSSLSS